MRAAFKAKLEALLNCATSRVIYIDETSFSAGQEKTVKCWQLKSKPLRVAIPTKRPHNLTIFGGVGNCITTPVFFLARSTNQHDMVRFLQFLRKHISPGQIRQHHTTTIVLDNHKAHKAKSVQAYIAEDFKCTDHRFELMFQPPYTSQFNSQETVWALVKRRF